MVFGNFYFKLYNQHHKLLDIIEIFNNLTYTKTLNGINQLSFSTPIPYLLKRNIELVLGQHIELYRVDENNVESLIWYGVVNSPAQNNGVVDCLCLGYASLLQNRNFLDIEYNSDEKDWVLDMPEMTYGTLIHNMLGRVNHIHSTGISIGKNVDTAIKTQRRVYAKDNLYDKLQEFVEDSKCYFEIDADRNLNFYSNYGIDKSNYYEINDYSIAGAFDFAISYNEIINVVNVRNVITRTNDNGGQYDELISLQAKNDQSIDLYGYREHMLDIGSMTEIANIQSEMLNYLNTYREPLIALNTTVKICDTFNIFDINVGDMILINSETHNLCQKIRLLEYTVNVNSETVDINVGNGIIRPEPVKIYRY